MLEPWIALTIAAAGIQSLRTAMQKHLRGTLPNAFVNFARYAFGAPLAALVLALWIGSGHGTLAPVSPGLVATCMAIALCQILGTAALIAAFSTRNVAAAVTFMKTEALQTALLSVLVLGEVVSGLGWIAIAVSAIGILVLTVSPTPGAGIATAGSLEGAAYGLGAGALFGLSAVFIRMAATSLAEVDVLSRSLHVLALTTALQLAMLGAYLATTDRKGFATFARKWRPSLAIGTASVASSIGWFTAMTLQNPAYVQALGQVELIFSVMVSRAAFREVPAGREMLGMAIFAGGIILLLLSTQ